MKYFTLTSAFLIISCPFAFAQETDLVDESCVAIKDDSDRLACYDGKYGKTENIDTATTGPSDWQIKTEKSAIDDTTSYFAAVESNDQLKCMFSEANPVLVLRCMENKTSLIINTNCQMADYQSPYDTIELRVDDKPAKKLKGSTSTDSNAIGLWDGGDSIPVIKTFAGAKKILVRVTPFDMAPQTFTFNVNGVDDVIESLGKTCGW